MELEKAKKIAASLLSYKSYTCQEIYQRLVRKGIDGEMAEQAVAEFAKAGILNDAEYARMYIHDALVLGMKGLFRIKQELRAKGIALSVIERAAEDVDVDAEEMLESYVRIRFGDKEFSDRRELEKAKAHLARRGFSLSEINRCFKKLNITVRSEEF